MTAPNPNDPAYGTPPPPPGSGRASVPSPPSAASSVGPGPSDPTSPGFATGPAAPTAPGFATHAAPPGSPVTGPTSPPPAGTAPTTATIPGRPLAGPPTPPGAPSVAPRRSRGAGLAVVLALFSLIVSLGTAAIAWRALDQAGDARDIALAGNGGAKPTAAAPGGGGEGAPAPTTAAAPVDTATEGASDGGGASSTTPPKLDERTVYTPDYPRQTLTITTNGCNGSGVDLDEPRVNGNNAELFLVKCYDGQLFLKLGEGVSASSAVSATSTPTECSEKIRTTPLIGESKVPARQGQVLCLSTSYSAAKSSGDKWRMVLVEVTGVGNDNTTATISATAWVIPG